ncbi:D-Ala-D-Ala carboxypeptidase family metallohydrolase [Salinibacter grassmerensis]|uniref:D-Ala-D-Ala carboxypeptidase family metallohydrolase n=1 Tax=Salinibacter grassmerensis TaxID=3040353 RepID=UPI003C6E6087
MDTLRLTKNFDLQEFTGSAEYPEIDNTPNASQIQNLRSLCVEVLQPVRSFLNRPVQVTSGFRSEELNKAVGGVSGSLHKKGKAADIVVPDKDPQSLSRAIDLTDLPVEENIPYPELGHVHLAQI